MSVCFTLNVALRVKYEDAADAENDKDSGFGIKMLGECITFDCKLVELIVEEDRGRLEEDILTVFMVDTTEEVVNLVAIFG